MVKLFKNNRPLCLVGILGLILSASIVMVGEQYLRALDGYKGFLLGGFFCALYFVILLSLTKSVEEPETEELDAPKSKSSGV